MTIDLDVDFENVISLSDWLQSEEAGKVQRHLEAKIMNMLFSHDPESITFQRMIAQLAWIGSRPETKSLLEREIIALDFSKDFSVEQCGLWKELKKGSHKVGHFMANHALEIAVGVAICATGVGIAAVTGYALSASVGGVVVAGAGSIFNEWEEQLKPKRPPISPPDPQACSKSDLAFIQQPLPSSLPKIELPSLPDQLLITADGIWANGQFFSTEAPWKNSMFSSGWMQSNPEGNLFSIGHPETNWKTFAYYAYLSSPSGQNDNVPSYQERGRIALALGDYNQSVQDFGKAIESDQNPISYLQRGAAYFGLGEYDASLEDYQQFASQTETTYPLSVSEFSTGFAKGLPKGVYESGEGLLQFLTDFVKHPIQTSKQMIDAVTVLVDLARNDEWGVIAETLSPEAYQLVTEWDTLPSDKRGELAGYVVGKHGADILLPGALAKVANKSVKSAQELAAVCKNLQIAQETLILETAAGIGNSAKVAEVVRNGQTMMALGEEIGLTAREIAQLKQAGKLEGVINNGLENLVSQAESDVYKAAISQNKHVKMVRDYLDKSAKEIQKGINSYEKQIAIHRDKIANPTKYYPDWDKLDPRQCEALINKKWPAEIQGYEEQRSVLQSILNERISHE